MSYFPWSVLGLDGPADERSIRSAYAKRLRQVRPDTDPVAFQALVEARDVAMRDAHAAPRHTSEPAATDQDPPDGENWSHTEHEPSRPATHDPPVAWQAGHLSGDLARPPIPTAPSVEMNLSDPTSDGYIQVGKAAQTPDTLVIDLHREDSISDVVAPRHCGPVEIPDAIEPPAHVSVDEAIAELRAFFERASATGGADVLRTFDDLPLGERGLAEAETFKTVVRYVRPVLSGLSARTGWRRKADESALSLQRKRRDVILGLDQVFGWSQNDRTLYNLLPRAEVDDGLMLLVALARQASTESAASHAPRSPGAVPVLAARDFAVFFGNEYPYYEQRYRRALTLGRWPFDWEWRRFWYGPLWALGLGQYAVLVLWIGALVTLGFVHNGLSDLAREALPVASQSSLVFMAITLVSLLPVLAVHVLIGAYGAALEIKRAGRRIARADRRMLFDPSTRQAFLQKNAPDFRVPKPPRTKSFWEYWWFWWGIIILFRLIFLAVH